MDRRESDLVIIGAGPAGCAAALRARQAGFRVMMVENSAHPSRQRPGETLHPGIEPLFAQLGVLERVQNAGFHRHRGIWVEWDSARVFQAYGQDDRGPWRGFQAERSRLDALLLAAARDAGVDVVSGCRPAAVLRNAKGEIAGLETTAGPIGAPWIVDASGRRAWLATELALKDEQHSPPLRARFGWSSGSTDLLDDQPILQAQPGGWNWRAPLGADRSAWVNLRVAPIDRGIPKGAGAAAARSSQSAGIDLRWRFLPMCAGSGYFILGDAAATLDPSSSHGVLRALMSGILAGYLLEAVETKSLDPTSAAAIYRNWMRAQFSHDAAALRNLWKRHPCEVMRREMGRSWHEPSLTA